MSSAGFVRVELSRSPRSGRAVSADVTLHRPVVARLLIGRAPDEAAKLVGMLHAVCGSAHRLAAHRAIEAARCRSNAAGNRGATASCGGTRATPPTELERMALAEMTMEHLTRLYVDWPVAIGQCAQPAAARGWRRRLNDPACSIPGVEISALLRHAHALLAAVPPIAGIRQRLRRRVRQTLACLMAVKLEPGRPGKIRRLVTPPGTLMGAPPASGSLGAGEWPGEGRALTARGELIHRLWLAHDALGREVVSAWAIEAPTDRLFVTDGPVAQALAQIDAQDRESLQRFARLVVLSFDPCVESRIEIREAEDNDA